MFDRLAIILIVFGVIYLVKPDIFQRWFWKRTAISQRILTPEQNKVYMRVLGAAFIVVGIVLLLRSRPGVAPSGLEGKRHVSSRWQKAEAVSEVLKDLSLLASKSK